MDWPTASRTTPTRRRGSSKVCRFRGHVEGRVIFVKATAYPNYLFVCFFFLFDPIFGPARFEGDHVL